MVLYLVQRHRTQSQSRILKLKSITANYKNRVDFKVGDIIQWKEGLKNKMFPEYNEPAIILEILDEPLVDTDDRIGSPYYKEQLDLKLGMIDDDGDLVSFYFDGNRFEFYKEN